LLFLLLPGIQALLPFRRPLEGMLPLRDEEAENLWSGMVELFEIPTGSGEQAKINSKTYLVFFLSLC